MEFDILDSYELAGVVSNLPDPPSTYWLDLAFPTQFQSDTATILFDKVTKGKRLAPFVAPNVQGQPMLAHRQSIEAFTPAYIKPKDPLDPSRAVRRRAGEAIGAPLTQAQRMDAILAETLQDQRDAIYRRWEWMACEAVTKGQVTVEGENYPAVTVGFNRNAANTKGLTGTAMWSNAAANPVVQVNTWASEMLTRSGRALRRITFTPSAWQAFINNTFVQKYLETRRGSRAELETALISSNAVTYHGTWPGGIELYEYNETYEDNQGNLVPYVEDGKVVLSGEVGGVRAFGAIQDAKAGFASSPLFSKMWEQEDPSVIFVMSQSAPLMIPVYTDATMSVEVLG